MREIDMYRRRVTRNSRTLVEQNLKRERAMVERTFKDTGAYRLGEIVSLSGNEEIDIRLNNMEKTSDEKIIELMPYEKRIDIGSYIKFDNDYWLTKEIEYNEVNPNVKMSKCTQKLKWVGVPINFQNGFPCTISNDSYGSKTVADNDFITMKDSKAKIITQANEYTRQIRPDWRFIFNNSETDIYKIIDVTTSIPAGLVTMTAKKDTLLAEDDLVNNLAFQKKDNFKKDEDTTTYSIVGDTYIKLDKTKEFKIDPVCYSDNLIWEVDNSKAEIITSDNNSCVIKAIKRNSIIKVIAKVNGTKIASTFVEVQ